MMYILRPHTSPFGGYEEHPDMSLIPFGTCLETPVEHVQRRMVSVVSATGRGSR